MSLARNLARLFPNASGLLPNANIEAMAANKLTGQVPDANAPSGSVIQVVTAQFNSPASTTSTSFVDTGIALGITPSSANSRILVVFNGCASINAAGTILFNLVRDSTTIAQPASGSQPSTLNYFPNSSNQSLTVALNWVDSPSTTAAITYKIQWRLDTSTTGFLFRHPTNTIYNSVGQFMLMEIAG